MFVHRAIGMLILSATLTLQAQQADPATHTWIGKPSPEVFEGRINDHLKRSDAAINRMLHVSGKRTIENTLAAYDEATRELDTAGLQSGVLQEVHPDAGIRDRAQALVQKVSAAQTALGLNQDVYKALSALDVSKADAPTRYYVQRTLLEFKLAGVNRDADTRAKIRKLSDEVTKLALDFQRNTQDDVRKISVKSAAELDGLPQDYIDRHKPGPDGTITLTSEPPDVTPVLKFAKNADLRQRVYLAYNTRAYPQNEKVLADLLAKRQELATVLGYPRWADLNAADKMAANANNIRAFIDELDKASKPTAEREYEMILAAARKQEPSIKEISFADSGYWREQLRRAEYNFNSQDARPYFPYDRVQTGILDTASKLFHVSFRAATDAEVWDPSVSTFDVFDGEKKLGRIYLDMHPRAGKDKWFSSYPLLDGVHGTQLPEATLICNFPGGTPGDPGLMEYGDVTTFFHEFGHLMHWIFQGQQRWAGFGGSLESDFVEAPSQMLEEWMHDPKVLARFAHHYQNDQPIPAELVERANRADAFGRGLWTRGQLTYTAISFDLHNMDPDADKLEEVEHQADARFLPFKTVEGEHSLASFTHLTGYSSAYYTYLWDKVIAEDFFGQFDHNDLLSGPTAARYRNTVLSQTGAMPASELVKNFLGRPQNTQAFVKWMNQEFEGTAAKTETAAGH